MPESTPPSYRKWLLVSPAASPRLRLFCFPFAGGGASAYLPWLKSLPEGVEVCPVQLPGREGRRQEVAFDRVQPLVEALAQDLLPLFNVPFAGSPLAFLAAVSLFILVNLSIGFLFSTMARTQMQAMQMTIFVFLPSILLSGFMFPFQGMPVWARVIGQALPTTHFIRAVRAIMLKGAGLGDVWGNLWPLMVILAAVATLALRRYRRTLD